MENKYYTPEIEEFHIGFEYESLEEIRDGSGNKTWNKWMFRNSPSEFKRLSDDAFPTGKFKNLSIRVKYLDQEDIESLGFKYIGNYEDDQGIHLLFEGKRLKHSFECCDIRLYENGKLILSNSEEDKEDLVTYFQGTIKNKSELKRILKQIGYEQK